MAAVTVKKDVPQWRTTIPRTKPSCAWSVRMHSCLVRFHTFTLWTKKTSCQCHEWVKKNVPCAQCQSMSLAERNVYVLWQIVTSPSQEPESRVERLEVCLAMQFTPSLCPSREARKGLANTLSSLVEFRAWVYSLHTSNGWSVGS